jgi:pimeloyl-ACP methyl ester carboxylesterase
MKLQIFFLLLNFVNGFSQTPKKMETVNIDGARIYYESYGKGEPLLLLHGFTQSSKSWHSFVDDYADLYEVYLIDLQGHGRSSPFSGKLSIRSVARDVNALVSHLNLTNINAIGFSYGGDVLFQLALLNPSLIRSMITIGACGSWDAKDFPHWVEYLSYENIDNLSWMKDQQTSEDQIKSILAQMVNYKVSVNDDEMKSINAKVLFVLGDKDDGIPLECISHARTNLPRSYLWILPNTGHGAHNEHKAEFVRVSREFFKDSFK